MSTSSLSRPKLQQEVVTMQRLKHAHYSSWLYGPFGGAIGAVGLAFAYALLFVVYAIIRSSLLVIGAKPDAGVPGTIVAYAVTLTIPSLVICAMMAVPAALVGLLTATILKRLLSAFDPQHAPGWAVIVGSATCLVIVVVLHLAFQRALGFTLRDVAANPETYLLWLGFPSLIYIAAGGVTSWELNLQQTRSA